MEIERDPKLEFFRPVKIIIETKGELNLLKHTLEYCAWQHPTREVGEFCRDLVTIIKHTD